MSSYKVWLGAMILIGVMTLGAVGVAQEALAPRKAAFVVSSSMQPCNTTIKGSDPYRYVKIPTIIARQISESQKQLNLPLKGVMGWHRIPSAAYGWRADFVSDMGKHFKDAPVFGFDGDWQGMGVNGEFLYGRFGAGWGFCGAGLSVTSAVVEGIVSDPAAKGKALAEQLKGANDKMLLVFTTRDLGEKKGLTREFLRGVAEGADKIMIVGGRINSPFLGSKTFAKDAALGIMLAGDIKVGMRVVNYMQAVAGPFQVTKAEGSKLYELDGKPCRDVYCQAVKAVDWGPETERLNRKYPFAVKRGEEFIVSQQAPWAAADGSFEFEQPVKPDAKLYIVKRDQDLGLARLRKAVKDLALKPGEGASGLWVMDTLDNWYSVEKSREKIKAIRAETEIPSLMFYVNGEFVVTPEYRICGDGASMIVLGFGEEGK